jgi:hypothetical protein
MTEEVAVPSGSRVAALRQGRQERLDRFHRSGLSVVAFCRSEGVSCQAFSYWKQCPFGEQRS